MNKLKRDAEYTILTYSGYRGDEAPRSLVSAGRQWPVDKILSRKRVFDLESKTLCDEYECRVAGETVRIRLFSTGKKVLSFPI